MILIVKLMWLQLPNFESDIMKLKLDILLRIFLWVMALHSFLVGIGLILVTNDIRILFGFKPSPEHFFQIQGGVFHIVMALGYTMPALSLKKFESMVIFSIFVKLCATLFLLLYFTFGSTNWLILFSGIIDFLMCIIAFILYKLFIKEQSRLKVGRL